MKTKLIIAILFLLSENTAMAQAPYLNWAKSFGALNSDEGTSVTADAMGNVYTLGLFNDTVDFDPGPGVQNRIGINDMYICKLDSDGNFVWVKTIGNNVDPNSIFIDNTGNIYTTGTFADSADFDPGPGIYKLINSPYCQDVFVSKLDINGDFIWAKSFKSSGGSFFSLAYGFGSSIFVDLSGNVYTTGSYQGMMDFDPGSSISSFSPDGWLDMFISKLDSAGNFVWAKSMNGNSYEIGMSIAVDTFENVYTTGYFMDTVDFDPGPSVYNLMTPGDQDIFVSKLDASGNFLWAKQMGSANYDNSNSLGIDAAGNSYITGFYNDTVDFDPGPSVFNLIGSGNKDIFICKLDASGNFAWAKNIGESSSEQVGKSVCVDRLGNVYTTGFYASTVDFDPGASVFNLSSIAGNADIFISKLNTSGNFVWAKSVGGAGYDMGNSIFANMAGEVFVAGTFMDTADFNPGTGVYNMISQGYVDAFVLKLSNINVGIEENNSSNTFNVYPNPSSGQFNLSGLETGNKIEVFDILGQLIYQSLVKNDIETIDLNGKVNGVYFITVSSDAGTITKRIVKQ